MDSIDCTPPKIAPSPSVQIELKPKPTDSFSPELSVYHRKRGKSKESETLADSPLLFAFEPKVKIPKSESHTMEENSTCTSLSDHDNSDENLPIALKKGVRECRSRPLYPIGKYVSYEGLSSSYQAFTSKINFISIPNSIQDTMAIPEWKKAVIEEVNALVKNGT